MRPFPRPLAQPFAADAWRLLAVTLSILCVALICIQPLRVTDFWLQVKIGELIVHNMRIPNTLLFPFTPAQNAPFHAHEWLPSVLFYALTQAVPEDALGLPLGALGLLLFAVLVQLAYRRSRGCTPVALLLGLLAMVVENFRHVLRPEVLALVLLVLYLLALERFRQRANAASTALALLWVVLWTNTHGSYVLAPLIAALFALGTWLDTQRAGHWDGHWDGHWAGQARPRHCVGLGLAVLACALLNAGGLDSWRFVLRFTLGPDTADEWAARNFVSEWLPITDARVRHLPGLWIGLGCLALSGALVLRNWRQLSSVDLLLFAMFAVLSLSGIRFLVYPGIAAVLVLAPLVPPAWQSAQARAPLFAAVLALSGTIFGVAWVYGNTQGNFPYSAASPYTLTAAMLRALDNPALQGNVITTLEFGGELVYRSYPRLRPSIDPRIDAYGGRYYIGHERMFHHDAELTAFRRTYHVKYLLLDTRHFALLMHLPSWAAGHYTILSLDHKAVLLECVAKP